MKRNYIYGLLFLLSLTACDGMYENIREYLDRGVVNYVGKPDSVYTTAGKERIKLSWWLNNDPRVKFCNIYWNDLRDSIIVPVDYNTMNQDGYISTVFNLPEGNYVFQLIHTASGGERSLATEAIGSVYGSNYESRLISRRITDLITKRDTLEINWRPAEDHEVKTVLEYLSNTGETVRRTIMSDENQTKLIDFVLEDDNFTFSKQSYYLPEPNALDTFFVTTYETVRPGVYYYWLDKTAWSAEVSGTFNSGEYAGPQALIDDNTETKWHCGLNESHPHWFIIDMKDNKQVKQFDILQHPAYVYVKSMRIRLSTDKINWTDIGIMTHSNNPRTVILLANTIKARYIRMETIEGYTNHANIAEVYVYGAD